MSTQPTDDQTKKSDFNWPQAVPEPVLRWVLFSLVASILPFVMKLLLLRIYKSTITITVFFGTGELFLVTCAIATDTMGDLYAMRNRELADARSLLLGAITTACVLFSIFVYGCVSVPQLIGSGNASGGATPVFDHEFVSRLSLALFFVVACCGIVTKWSSVPQGAEVARE